MNKGFSTDDFDTSRKGSIGNPVVSETLISGFVDSWRKQPSPDLRQLVKEYESTAYACANLNANAVAAVPLRLYVTSERNAVSNRRFPTKAIGSQQKQYLTTHTKIRLSSSEQIEEVTEHPLLDLLSNPNEDVDGCELIEITQLFQEIAGIAYWVVVLDGLGRPQEVFYLRSQDVRTLFDNRKAIGISYCGQNILFSDPQYGVIKFAMPSLTGEPTPPLRAVWEAVGIMSKYESTLQAMLDNNARPDLIVSPKGDGYIGQQEQERYEARFVQKFSRAGSGGVLFLDEEANVTPLTFSPRDLSMLSLKGASKIDICNAYGIPVALLEGAQFNRATLDGSRLQHALQAIVPRIKRIESKLNKYLVPLYDSSGRLFVAFDQASPENRAEKLTEVVGLVRSEIITRNEARNEYNLPGHEHGDFLITPKPGLMFPDSQTTEQTEEQPTIEAIEQTTEPAAEQPQDNLQQQALNGAQIQALVEISQNISDGLIPLETGRAIIIAAFPTLSEEQVDNIINPLTGFEKPKPEQQPPIPAEQPSKLWLPNSTKRKPTDDNLLNAVPESEELAAVISDFFKSIEPQTLSSLTKGFRRTNGLPERFVPLDEWTDELTEKSKPVIELIYDKAAKKLLDRVGASSFVFDVTNPKLQEAIRQAAFAFAQSTIETTAKEINDAIQQLRESLTDGLTEGDRLSDLRKRVKTIFENIDQYGAQRIANSEASRSHHLGQRMAGIESGVVKGWRWILSPEPCPICQQIAEKFPTIPLEGKFTTRDDVTNPAYRDVLFAPAHPFCKCTVAEILDIDE